MAREKEIIAAIKLLIQEYDREPTQLSSECLPAPLGTPKGKGKSTQLGSPGVDGPGVLPQYFDPSMLHEVHLVQNIYTSDHDMSSIVASGSGYEMQLGSGMGHYPYCDPSLLPYRSATEVPHPGTASIQYPNSGGLDGHVMDHGHVEPDRAQGFQLPTMPGDPSTETIRHDELYPNHWIGDQTSSETHCQIIESFTPSLKGTKPIIGYRCGQTQPWGSDGAVGQRPTPWMTEDGRTIVNSEASPLRRSRYLPQTVSTKIEGWRMELIIRLDPNVTDKDFLDRMPIGSELHPRPQLSALTTRRRNAREKYVFHELRNDSVTAFVGKQDPDE